MDQHIDPTRNKHITLQSREECLMQNVTYKKTDFSGEYQQAELYNIENDIKTETIDIVECGALELQEVIEKPPPERVQKWKYFTCTSCSYKSKYKYNLIRHAKKHEMGKKPVTSDILKCEKCPFETDLHAILQKHNRVHSEIYYNCASCDFGTKYKESLAKHQLTHKSPSECVMFSCDECEYEAKQKLSLKRHMLTHKRLEEVEHFKCPYCKFATKHQLSINNHILAIHRKDKVEKYKCPECDFSTYHKISLKGHRLTHRKPGEVPMYKCPECPYETKNKAFLPNHMKSHMETVPCPKCQKLITQRGMPLHLKTHESGDVKNRYKCKECHYATLYFGNLSRHMKIMHSNKEDIDYKQCPECPFKTFENARLKRHIKEIHSSEAPEFKCGECEFNSKFNSCLKRHVETAHGNRNPETCPVCFKPSANIYTLRIHMKLHRREEEVKMFQCGDCPYKTRHSGAYKEHVLRHKSPDEVTQYKCTNCSFQTKNKSYLMDHIARYSESTSKKRVCCPCCCFKTSTQNNLRIHMSKVHRNEMDPKEFWHCAVCGFKTLNKRVISDHMKAHRREGHNASSEGTNGPLPDVPTNETEPQQMWETSGTENHANEIKCTTRDSSDGLLAENPFS